MVLKCAGAKNARTTYLVDVDLDGNWDPMKTADFIAVTHS
jgi:hypothetical protein